MELEHIDKENGLGVLTDSQMKFANHILKKSQQSEQYYGNKSKKLQNIQQGYISKSLQTLVRMQLENASVGWALQRIKLKCFRKCPTKSIKTAPLYQEQVKWGVPNILGSTHPEL